MFEKIDRCRGFTLIELLVVVAIIGILASVAYPMYIEHIRKARRSDGESVLAQAAQFMERSYSLSQRYDQAVLPSSLTVSPVGGSTTYYRISISAAGTDTFVLSATPQGAQAADRCGTLTLSNTGAKTPATGCW